ncbi:MAG TPA: tyrosine-type recombinase/integrase [Chloroflexia bacterium]|nr:tyrosine-type recombinase/integrase [Chloroflexia bacterium]
MLDHEPIGKFLASLQAQQGFSENTLAAYRNDLNQFADFLSASQGGARASLEPPASWGKVSRDHILSFLLYLRERKYANTTIARKQAAIKSFFKYLTERGTLRANPAQDLVAPHVDRALPHTINAGEVDRLLHEMYASPSTPETLRDRAMMQLLYATGLRVGETVALNVGDVDSAGTSVSIISRGKTRRVPITDRTSVEALRDYLQDGRPRIAPSDDRNGDDAQALFLNHRGQRLTRQGFWLILKRYAKSAGLDEISPHTLRHSFAAQKLKGGANMRDLQQILGHANISTTQVYGRIGQPDETKGRR